MAPHHQPAGTRADPVYVVRTTPPGDGAKAAKALGVAGYVGALVTALAIGAIAVAVVLFLLGAAIVMVIALARAGERQLDANPDADPRQ